MTSGSASPASNELVEFTLACEQVLHGVACVVGAAGVAAVPSYQPGCSCHSASTLSCQAARTTSHISESLLHAYRARTKIPHLQLL